MSGRVISIAAPALALVALFVTVAAAPAHAEEPTPEGVITWSVKPADADGKDGRSWIELDADPGDVIEEHAAVTNFSDTTVTFALSAADGYFTDTGRFTMLPSSQPSVAAGTWIAIPESVVVGPDETVVVPFTITVPDNATPGDNAAGVAASVFSSGANDDGTQVGLESRVGFRVMTRVSGELAPSFSIQGLTSSYDMSWNPLQPGSLTISYDLVNDGNTRLLITGAPDASGRFGAASIEPATEQELLPGDSRHLEQVVDSVWPIGLARVVIDADALITPGDSPAGSTQREIWVWVMPWPQLIILLGAGFIVVAIVWRRRRSRAELATLLDDVRRETERAVRSELDASTGRR